MSENLKTYFDEAGYIIPQLFDLAIHHGRKPVIVLSADTKWYIS